jgi:hypothetical protein
MKRLLAAAAVLASLTPAAFAGQLTLFSDGDFRGNQVTLRGDVPNLRDIGFNDRTSSLVIRSGTWQICEHKDFGGYCAELGPGEYRELSRFNDRISSAREVSRGGEHWRGGDDYRRGADYRGGEYERRGEYDRRGERDGRRDDYRDDYRGDYGSRGGPAVQMFSGQRFEGEQVGVSGDLHTLRDVNFNDRAGSMVIREGRWEFCEHADYRGQCVVFGPGRYPFLEAMNNRISSMRRVR